ncbi:hypothetical protein SteCoe_17877 [Stentor coeruleus]|uniref:Uncharacterized protein n=1 Tax=Stentor coeruleus TaxID=5963 RepID=A0A1R2BYA0_9CILI|nr:hypothetical protein SteCoe_17877 [Stentor coeruleus]
MRELNETSLFSLVEQILTRLLIENLEKVGGNGEGELMLKTLNGTMLRVLEHCRPTRTFIVLIRLLTKYKSGASLQKMTGLIIRCLLKLTKIMSGLIHQIEIDKLLLVMHEYLSGYKLAGIDDLGSKTIKTILTEVVKLQGPTIWTSYEEIRKHSVPDVHMEKWITAILNSSTHGPSTLISPRSKPIDIISDIFSIIKHDYTKGFTQLMEHFTANPTVDYTSYISTLPIELQQKVREDLEVRLKKKESSTENTNIGGCNFQDFKERLSMMKQRYGIATSNAQPSDVTATLDNLRNKVSKKNDDPSSMTEIKSRIQNFRNSK